MLVVDDQGLIREAIASLLGVQPGITVVGTAADGHEAVERAVALRPDIVLMDVRMPRMDGVRAVAASPRPRAGGPGGHADDVRRRGVRSPGPARGRHRLPAEETSRRGNCAAAVRLAHAGVTQLDPAVTARLVAADGARAPEARVPLTARELEVLRLVAGGASNREIADRLYLSEGTVKNHISRILQRLGLRDRTQAAVYARDHGLLA